MSLVVLDIERIENKIVKELGVYQNGQTVGYSFFPPKIFKATSQSAWCTKHIHGINWNSGHGVPETEFFAKGYEKCKILSEILETKVTNLDDYACPKVQNLIFKDEEYDWRCSNYPFRYANTLHCAERKPFAERTWTRCFFNKL